MPVRLGYGSALAAPLHMEIITVGAMFVAGIGVGLGGSVLVLRAALWGIGRQIV